MKTMYRMNVELANNTAISMKSLNQDILQDDAADTDADGTEEENINLSNLYITVLRRIESEKLYLNPEFSMQVLSELVNRRQRYVSQALSEVGKTSFPNLVNNFRINEARRLIADNPNITVIEIMEKTGFGSRQNFNRSFKQATGFTPSEYQQRASDSHS
jgi:AraC-like DNA-binding protein